MTAPMEVRKLVLLVVPVLAMAAPPVAAQEFATHYHELADLTHTKEAVKTFHFACAERDGEVRSSACGDYPCKSRGGRVCCP